MKLYLAVIAIAALFPDTMARLGTGPAIQVAKNRKAKPDSKTKPIKKKQMPPLSLHQDMKNKKKRLNNEGQHRIINGTPAAPGEFPFFVDFGGCGASLIHEDIVLSAAHCAFEVYNFDEVYVGAFREQAFADGTQEGDFETRRIFAHRLHPDYNGVTMENDVMIIKIDSPSSYPPVALNGDPNDPTVGEDLVVIGHGDIDPTEDGQEFPEELHKVTVPYVSHDQCAADYGADAIVEEVMLCAGYEEGGKDSCQGDSGGPLLKSDGDNYVQVGITSFGDGCAKPNAPGVYTRVSGVKEWIDQQICALSDNPPADCVMPPGCHLPDVADEDCPPERVLVRAIPPNGETGGFDWDVDSTSVYYRNTDTGAASGCEGHVYENLLRYELIADQDLPCPDTINLEALQVTGAEINSWNQANNGPVAFSESGSTSNGQFYCAYEKQHFAVQLDRCPGVPEGQVGVLVKVTYDFFPEETGWSISQNDVVLASRAAGSVDTPGFLSERVYLDPGDYMFTMTDSYGDGICCDYGPGNWKLYAEREGEDLLMAESDGTFFDEESVPFTVPDPDGTGPGGNCEDSSSMFLVDSTVGDQDCAWLVNNQDRFDYLCRFVDVALACPKTCDICDLLDQQ